MRLDIYVYSALLAAGLGASYWASLPQPEGGDEQVSVFSIDPKSVTEMNYNTPSVAFTALRRPGDGHFIITYTKTEVPPENPHVPKDPKAPPPTPKVTTERFLASEKMDELLKHLNPLYSERILDKVDDKQLTDYGLKDSKDVWQIKTNGGKDIKLTLGKRSYGSRSRFAQEADAKTRVMIIDGDDLESLDRAPSRLYERRLTNVEFAEVSKADLIAGGKTKRLAHTQRDKDSELLWTDDEPGAKPKAAYDGLMDKISKLRLTEFAKAEEEAGLKELKPFLSVTLFKDNTEVDHLHFKKAAGDKPVYWMTSDYLQVHGKVLANRIEAIEKEAPAVVGGEAKP